MNYRTFMLSAAALILAGCNVPLPERVDFALPEKVISVSAEGGEYTAAVYSGESVTVTPDITPEWGVMTSPAAFDGDGAITFTFEANDGLKRGVNAIVSYNGGVATDTVKFQQEGIQAKLNLIDHAVFMDVTSQNTYELVLDTNVDPTDIEYDIEYEGSERGWLGGLNIGADKISFAVSAKPSDKVLKAIVRLTHTDGWGAVLRESFSVNVSNKDGKFGTVIDFPTLRSAATEKMETISEDWIMRGVVVSDFSSKNMEMNPNTDYNVVDTAPSDKTAYLVSEDGSLGLKLVFDSPADNKLAQGQIVEVILNGKKLFKETDPDRYTVTGLRIADIKSTGNADGLPVNVRKISTLTDNDINTFVEIQNTEFLNKEGCYSNVYDTFTLPSNGNKASVSNGMHSDCWPAMLVDDEGHTIYAIVNMLCDWRRTGNGVPQGVGPVRGILVHNVQPRYGDMGRYQIRVVDASGYAQSTTSGSSYKVLMKWDGKPNKYNFTNYGSSFPYVTTSEGMDSRIPSDDIVKSTGKCTGVLYFENKQGQPMSGTKAIRPCRTYDALKSSGSPGAGQVSDRGLSIQCNIGGWYNWDSNGKIQSYNGMVSEFSTASLSGKKLYLYFSFCCGGNDKAAFKNFPGRWCVEYSTNGGSTYNVVNAEESGKPYVHLRSFPFVGPSTINGRSYYPSYSVGMGFTEHFYEFPDDIMGHEKVLVRIRPYDTTVTVLPEKLDADIEQSEAYSGINIYQDLRINRINYLTK